MTTLEVSGASPAAPRAASIPPSCLHDAFRATAEWERVNQRRALRLHVGEPGFGPPRAAVEALGDAAREGRTSYTSAEGLDELRVALAAKLNRENGHRTSHERIFVSPGSAQGLTALMLSLASPGDEILLPEIHWPNHLQQALIAGFRPRFYALDDAFRADPAAVADAASERTRVVLYNTPSNPTGAVLDRDRQAQLLEVARAHGWQVISDEAYEHFVYDGTHHSMAALEAHLPEEERIVHSAFTFSKSYAMTGYRMGYIAVPHARAGSALCVVQEGSIVSPPTPVQAAALAALADEGAPARNHAAVRANRDSALPALVEAGALRGLPSGGWYALLDLRAFGVGAEEFTARLLADHGTAVALGRGFCLRPELDAAARVVGVGESPAARHLVRIAFCGDGEQLAVGVERLLSAVRGPRR